MHPTALSVGFFSIKTYGLFLAAAFLLAMRLASAKTSRAGISDEVVGKLFLWIILSGVAGARVFYMLVESGAGLSELPAVFRIWEGGLHYYGGLAGGIIAVCVFSLRHRDFPLRKFAAAAAPSLALGLAVGKIGCFFAGCCYGRECELPWAVVFTHPESSAVRGIPLHPVQIYESLVYLIVFASAEFLYRARASSDGELFWFTVFILSFVRFHMEFLRWETPVFAGLSVGALASAAAALLSLVFMVLLRPARSGGGVRL